MDPDLVEAIESAVRARDFFTLSIIAFITILVAAFSVWIVRFRVATQIAQMNGNFSELKEQQKELRKITAEIEYTLEKQSEVFKLRSAAYIERSVTAITAIYDSLLMLRNAALGMAYNDVAEHAPEFRDRINDFRNEFDVQRVWLPRELADYLDSVAADMSNRATQFIIAEERFARVEQLHTA